MILKALTLKKYLKAVKKAEDTKKNIIEKLAITNWGSIAAVLQTSALALDYSVAEHCNPVGLGAHTLKCGHRTQSSYVKYLQI